MDLNSFEEAVDRINAKVAAMKQPKPAYTIHHYNPNGFSGLVVGKSSLKRLRVFSTREMGSPKTKRFFRRYWKRSERNKLKVHLYDGWNEYEYYYK